MLALLAESLCTGREAEAYRQLNVSGRKRGLCATGLVHTRACTKSAHLNGPDTRWLVGKACWEP